MCHGLLTHGVEAGGGGGGGAAIVGLYYGIELDASPCSLRCLASCLLRRVLLFSLRTVLSISGSKRS